ncbi:MAG TPA: hypothetical protein VHY33_14155 [Thermoanaerobaculia bacterium]|jgi:hypothetical protein|nr:hypothetical protein [Thermoanaerobaculia bacterium]
MASDYASQPDPRKSIIFKCIQDAFADSGLKPIKSPQDQIVWTQISPEVRDDIADFLETCISKQIKPPIGDLSGPLTVLVAHAPVMVVGDLVNDLIALLDSMGQGN